MEGSKNRSMDNDGPTTTFHKYIKIVSFWMINEQHRTWRQEFHDVGNKGYTECWGNVGSPNWWLLRDVSWKNCWEKKKGDQNTKAKTVKENWKE